MIRTSAGFLLLAVGFSLPAFAQVQAGRIVGTVFDPNRAVVPGAAVTITGAATNQSTRVQSNDLGDYVVTPLNPGLYNVTVSFAGFQTSVVNNVEVLVGQSARVDVELRLGETTTKVEVVSASPLLDTESGTLGHVVSNTQVVNLPLNGRSFYELARLMPGAALLPGGGNLLRIRANFISGTAISGVLGRQTSFLLDGVDVTDHHQGGTLIQTSIDALQEFKVQQSAYTAEFSSAGGMLNATTKAGSNDVHGALFEFLRNDKLDARNFFLAKREVLKRNQFGGIIGGPLSIPHLYDARDKMFFAVSYEAMRERQGLVFNNIVPSAAMKGGDYSAPGLPVLYDPMTTANNNRTAFANNIIPQNRLSAQALFFNKFVPDPNTASGTAAFAPARALDVDQFTIRIDRKLTDAHRFFARWSFHDNRQDDPNAYPSLGIAPLHTRGQNVAASVTSTLRPTLIHEFRFHFLPQIVDLQAFGQGTDFNKQAGIRGFEDTARPGVNGSFPDFAWSGYAPMNGSAFDQRPKTQDLRVYEWTDNLTWIRGRHIVKFGGDIRYWVPLFTDSKQYVGNWSFNGFNTENPARPAGSGDAFADWMLGLARQVTRAYPGDVFGGYATFWHFFAQDDLKVSNRLTLNLGLRYEYTPWLKGYRGQLGTFDGRSAKPIIIAGDNNQIDLKAQFAGPAAFPLFQDAIQTTSQAGLPLAVTYPDRRQWAPRFGFAWRPLGDRTVVRGGYGIFYEAESSTDRVNLNMVPFKLDETVFNDRGVVPDRTLADFFLGRPIGTFATAPSMTPTLTRLRMGNDQHWSFGVQEQLAHNTVLEVDYVGNKGSFLSATNPFNDPPAGAGSIQTRRPFPRFGGMSYRSQDTSSTYHSLQAKLEKRYSKGLWYIVSYTFSKSLTRQNTPSVGGDYAWEKALSGFDIPHNVAVSAGYELPIGKGKPFLSTANRFVDGVLGGWQMQGILVWRRGRPFTATVSRDVANNGIGGQRPNRIGSGSLDQPTIDVWFDKTAFRVPDNFTYGNSGGDILREDSFKSFDFSVFKQFRVTERSNLQYRAEFFNLSNTSSFNAPATNIDVASGGRVTTTASTPRQIQFALKYNF